jgi:NAD(P)-dependent dehydrogenase (short-subunit alcohol dehydrogenase family)
VSDMSATAQPMRLEAKVALVTGAGRGIGRAIALHCADQGADLVLAARSVPELESVASEVRERDRRALAVATDVGEETAVERLLSRTRAEFGYVDVLIANSGVGGPTAPLWEIDPQQWRQTFEVNVTGTYLCCRAVLPSMIERRSGSIVIIGSMTGKRPLRNRSPYASSKMALLGLVRTLAAEVGRYDVRVNLISPGAVRGERLKWVIEKQAEARDVSYEEALREFEDSSPLGRLVEADDVARAVGFLASDDASSITGVDLNVTGGMIMY